jgi:hypothetical protein
VDPTPLVERILNDEGLTADLDEAAATLLLQELTARARKVAAAAGDLPTALRKTEDLCRSARELVRQVASGPQTGDARASALKRLLPRLPG